RRLFAARESLGERLRQPGFADLGLGLLDVVGDAAEMGLPALEVDPQVGRPRITVARLADRARVEQPAALAQLELAAALGQTAGQLVSAELEGDRHVAVTDQYERCGRVGQRLTDDVLAEHVLPNRVARARVEELDAGPFGLRLERLEELARLGVKDVGRP